MIRLGWVLWQRHGPEFCSETLAPGISRRFLWQKTNKIWRFVDESGGKNFSNGSWAPFSRCPRQVRSTSDSGKIVAAQQTDVEGQKRSSQLSCLSQGRPVGASSSNALDDK